jgi:nitrate/nitrite transport system substrate-binding protein
MEVCMKKHGRKHDHKEVCMKKHDKEHDHEHNSIVGAPPSLSSYHEGTEAGHEITQEEMTDHIIEGSVINAIFGGDDVSRRQFMKLVGSATALAVISDIFPLEKAKAFANDKPGTPEKTDLKIGFIPITCATPILVAQPLGIFDKYGIGNSVVLKAPGWGAIRDWAVAKKVDCSHMLSPMPLAMTLGVISQAVPYYMPAIDNVNGQAITLHMKHKSVKTAKDMKGFTLCVPFEQSMHNYLLRYFLAEGGLDPDKDVKIKILPPPEMVVQLKAGTTDGYLSPDPFNQRAVYEGIGFIFKLSREIWPGHPCCGFAMSKEFITTAPNSFKAIFKSIIEAAEYAHKAENRESIAELISGSEYLNQPLDVVKQVLTGKFPDGLGNNMDVPDRIDFAPLPWQSMAVWILTQMKRWGYLKADVNFKKIAEEVFLAADCAKVMEEVGAKAPSAPYYTKHTIMGKDFDATSI